MEIAEAATKSVEVSDVITYNTRSSRTDRHVRERRREISEMGGTRNKGKSRRKRQANKERYAIHADPRFTALDGFPCGPTGASSFM